MARIRINFVKLLAAKSEEENTLLTPADVARETEIDRRKLYVLRDMSENGSPIDDAKLPLKFGEIKALCDYFRCRFGELVEYEPDSRPLEGGQQMHQVRQLDAAVI